MTQITSLIFLPGIEVTHQLITRAKKPRFVYNRRTKRQVDNNVVTLEADEPIDINTNFTPPVSTSLYSEKCIILEGQGQAGQGRTRQDRAGQGKQKHKQKQRHKSISGIYINIHAANSLLSIFTDTQVEKRLEH